MKTLKRTWADISLDNLEYNYRSIRAHLPSGTRFLGVMKADAYGHGAVPVSRALADLGAEYLAVSNLEEAVQIRRGEVRLPILILGYTPPEFAPELARNDIIQGVLSLEYARQLQSFAHQPVRCHIKLDTGMGRIGFRSNTPEDCAKALLPLFELDKLSIEGIYTHFAVADSVDADDMAYTQAQEDFIVAVYDRLAELGHTLKHLHFMNSAATVTRPNPRATLARVGIIMYGLEPNYPVHVPMELQPVMSLRSVVSHVKQVDAGTCISYGRTYTADKPRTIATVTIGYADGYARLLSNQADALLHGRRCPIVGRVCMDQLMLDVTDVPEEVKPGDVVTMFGTDGEETITADELAALYGTIGYEIVCGISKRVPRDVIGA